MKEDEATGKAEATQEGIETLLRNCGMPCQVEIRREPLPGGDGFATKLGIFLSVDDADLLTEVICRRRLLVHRANCSCGYCP